MGKVRVWRRWWVLLPVWMLILTAGMALKAHAGQFTMQYNDTYITRTVSGNGADYYLLPATKSGYADITYIGSPTDNSYIYICDANKRERNGQLVGGGTDTWRYRVWLSNTTADGNVWVKIKADTSKKKNNSVKYQIKAQYTKVSGANVTEPNSSLAAARQVTAGKTYTTALTQNDYRDYYAFTLGSSQSVTVTLTSQVSRESWPDAITGWSGPFTLSQSDGQICALLYNSKGVAVSNGGKVTTVSVPYGTASVTEVLYSGTLPAGKYYIGVGKPGALARSAQVTPWLNNGIYKLKVSASASAGTDPVTPDEGKLTLSKSSVKVAVGSTVTLTASVSGEKAQETTFAWGSSDTQTASVSGGKIEGHSVGSATITVISSDGQTADCTVNVVPARVTGVKLRSVKKKAGYMRVLWGKQSSVTGYQVQIAANRSFKNRTSKKVTGAARYHTTFSGLKKGTRYYVRVRAYATYGGKTHYGAWSKVVSMKQKN